MPIATGISCPQIKKHEGSKMFCNRCRTVFEEWTNKHGDLQSRYCPTCYQKTWDAPKEISGIDHYCVYCGETLSRIERAARNGKTYLTSGHKRFCENCRSLAVPVKTQRKCIVCGAGLIGKAHKYCPDHKPVGYKINPVTNRRSSLAWQKNNPAKVNAQVFARMHPAETYVLYECRCEHPRKHNHHFNYKLKNIVIRLCPQCHAAEHARLRLLAAQSANNSSTPAVNASAEDRGTMAAAVS